MTRDSKTSITAQTSNTTGPPGGAGASGCAALSGTAWVSQTTGTHDSSVSITQEVLSVASQPIIGLGNPAPPSKEITVTIDMSADLGESGSLTLVAEAEHLSAGIEGGVYAVLVSLNDGVHELVNLARAGAGGDCAATGFFWCFGSYCEVNPACSVAWPSAYFDRANWEQHQFPDFGFASVNTFPTCNSGGGTQVTGDAGAEASPQCAFNQIFFPGAPGAPVKKLVTGTYTAKYVLVSEKIMDMAGRPFTGDLKVTAIKKSDSAAGGTMDLNVILVGSKNVKASRNLKGQHNLNLLFDQVASIYSAANISIGAIHAIEWGCAEGGDSHASTKATELNQLFTAATSLLPPATTGKALNVFLVSDIPYSAGSGMTILGVSGGIGGSMLGGPATSGLVFSSFDQLAVFNVSCAPGAACPLTRQDAAFVDMGTTIAHEIGHYLGLNHPSEADGAEHDVVYDTPACSNKSPYGYITIDSCRDASETHVYGPTGKTCNQVCASYNKTTGTFCAAALECQFNHTMWWTSKNFHRYSGRSDGSLFSTESRNIMGYNPYLQ